jgi:hypothetical protein
MKRYLVYSFTAVFVLAMATIAVVSNTSAAPPFAPFVGRWESTDTYDGSHQTLSIGGGKNAHFINYVDEGASICGVDESGDPIYAAYGRSKFAVDDLQLSATLDLYCRTHPPTLVIDDILLEYTYLPETDTLVDNYGNTWFRK